MRSQPCLWNIAAAHPHRLALEQYLARQGRDADGGVFLLRLQIPLYFQRRKVILQAGSWLLKDAIGAELIQPLLLQAFLLAATQNLDVTASPQGVSQQFFSPHDAGEDLLCWNGDILLNRLAQAAAAVPALLGSCFAKIPQQIGPQAAACTAIPHHLIESLEIPGSDLLLLLRSQLFVLLGVFDHKPGCTHITGGIEQDAVGWGTVPSRTASFLIVALQIPGHIIVEKVKSKSRKN